MALVRSTRRPARIAFPSTGIAGAFPGFEDVENQMNRFMQRAFGEPFSMAFTEPLGWNPAIDIVESANELTVSAELPGMEQKDIDLSVEDGVLTIRGEKTEEQTHENKKVHLYERNYGSFYRAFTLPANVDAEKIAAEFDKGVLKIHLPKDGHAKPKGRKVEIKST